MSKAWLLDRCPPWLFLAGATWFTCSGFASYTAGILTAVMFVACLWTEAPCDCETCRFCRETAAEIGAEIKAKGGGRG